MNHVLKCEGLAELPYLSLPEESHPHLTGELTLAIIEELALHTWERKLALTHTMGCGKAGSTMLLRGMVLAAQTDQLSCHSGTHPGL